jgi:DNA recombination-dependent growth factor C
MPVFSGALTLRRYRVAGEVPDDFRTRYADALRANAFHPPPSAQHKAEVLGWCEVHNLLDTEFDVPERWLYNQYLVAAMRVDKKTVPAKLFRAHLDKKVAAWCQEQGRTRCPASVKVELKDLLEADMLARCLPRVTTAEFCWNVVEGWLAFHNASDGMNDRFRTLFRNTFGLVLHPWSPLDFLGDRPDLVMALEVAGLSDYRPEETSP